MTTALVPVTDGYVWASFDEATAAELPYFARHGGPHDLHVCARDHAPGTPHACLCGVRATLPS